MNQVYKLGICISRACEVTCTICQRWNLDCLVRSASKIRLLKQSNTLMASDICPPLLCFLVVLWFFRCYPCRISPSLAVSNKIVTLSLSLHALVGHSIWRDLNANSAAGICECPNHFTYCELEKRLCPTIAKSLFYPSLPWMVYHPCMELHPARNGYSPCWI